MSEEGSFLVTYAIAVVCTFLSTRKLLPNEEFETIDLGGFRVPSVKEPREDSSTLHKKIYAWLLAEVPKLEKSGFGKRLAMTIVRSPTSASSEDVEDVNGDHCSLVPGMELAEGCIIEFRRADNFKFDDEIIVRRTHSTLRLLHVSKLSASFPEGFDVNLQIEDIRRKLDIDEEQRNNLGEFQVGAVSIETYTF